jgi:hypothetical protein
MQIPHDKFDNEFELFKFIKTFIVDNNDMILVDGYKRLVVIKDKGVINILY